MTTIKRCCEYLGGAETDRPLAAMPPLASWVWGVWWTLLAAAIMIFGGQASKFIYIDF